MVATMANRIHTDWHPEDIKAAIRKRGITVTDLARRHGVSKQALSLAMQARVSGNCERIIAAALGLDPSSIWPSRYHADGSRINFAARPEVAA